MLIQCKTTKALSAVMIAAQPANDMLWAACWSAEQV